MSMRIALAGPLPSTKEVMSNYLADVYGFGVLSLNDSPKFKLIDAGIMSERLFMVVDRDAAELLKMYCQVMRQQDSKVFVNDILFSMDFGEELGTEGHVINDLESPSDAETLRENGFILIRVGTGPGDTHDFVSLNTWESIQFDYMIDRNPDEGMPDFLEAVDGVIADIIKDGKEVTG